MAVRGNFKIADVWYKSHGGLPNQQLANQMASKVGQGTSKYADLTSWSAWVQDTFQDGIGKLEPGTNSGFLYGEVESRVPRQLILSQAIKIYTPHVRDNASDYKSWSLSPGQLSNSVTRATYSLANNNYLAWQFDGDTTAGNNDISGVWIYGECADATVLRADLYGTSGGNPVAPSLANASLTVTNDFPGPQWHFIPVVYAGRLHTSETWVVIRPTTGTFTPYGVSNLSPSMLVRSSTDGSAWSSVTTFQPFFVIQAVHATLPRYIDDISITTSSSEVIFWGRQSTTLAPYGWSRHASYPYLVQAKTFTPQIVGPNRVSVAVFDNEIVMGGGPGSVYRYRTSLALSGETIGSGGETLLSYGGYLWNAYSANDLYYESAFGSSTTVGQVCSLPWYIRSMAGMGQDLYLACDDGLYRNAPGDFIQGVAPWQPDEDNGRSMCNFGGALYIVVNGRVMRYSSDGSLQDVWVTRDDDLPSSRLGEVISVAATDLWVVALVKSTTGRCSVWAMQDQSWHHVATLPTFTAVTMEYIRTNSTLWIGTSDGYAFGVYMPSFALNPYNDTASNYMPAGWLEWDWFDGPVLEAQKDYESVTIMGENFAAGQYAKVYWKDDASTAWELLGTCDSNNEELIWTDPLTRPNTKRLKLGILLFTTSAAETPRIHAIRVKYHLMVSDWFRWSLAVDVSGRTGSTQEMLDGVNTLTASQIKANLDAIAAQVPPTTYQDVDGTLYLVKVNDANFSYTKQVYAQQTNTFYWEGVYRFVIEQVRPGVYTP